MLDINTIEQLDKIATPFYYYDMELFRKTVDHVAELAGEHGLKVHYAIKANVERRLLEYISSKSMILTQIWRLVTESVLTGQLPYNSLQNVSATLWKSAENGLGIRV